MVYFDKPMDRGFHLQYCRTSSLERERTNKQLSDDVATKKEPNEDLLECSLLRQKKTDGFPRERSGSEFLLFLAVGSLLGSGAVAVRSAATMQQRSKRSTWQIDWTCRKFRK